jgi:hypothetical protein
VQQVVVLVRAMQMVVMVAVVSTVIAEALVVELALKLMG